MEKFEPVFYRKDYRTKHSAKPCRTTVPWLHSLRRRCSIAYDLLHRNFAFVDGLISVKTGHAGMLVREPATDAEFQAPDLLEIGIGFDFGAGQVGYLLGIIINGISKKDTDAVVWLNLTYNIPVYFSGNRSAAIIGGQNNCEVILTINSELISIHDGAS